MGGEIGFFKKMLLLKFLCFFSCRKCRLALGWNRTLGNFSVFFFIFLNKDVTNACLFYFIKFWNVVSVISKVITLKWPFVLIKVLTLGFLFFSVLFNKLFFTFFQLLSPPPSPSITTSFTTIISPSPFVISTTNHYLHNIYGFGYHFGGD